jgi:hypothetical protein
VRVYPRGPTQTLRIWLFGRKWVVPTPSTGVCWPSAPAACPGRPCPGRRGRRRGARLGGASSRLPVLVVVVCAAWPPRFRPPLGPSCFPVSRDPVAQGEQPARHGTQGVTLPGLSACHGSSEGAADPSRPGADRARPRHCRPPAAAERHGRDGLGSDPDGAGTGAQVGTGPRMGCRRTHGPTAEPGRTRGRTGRSGGQVQRAGGRDRGSEAGHDRRSRSLTGDGWAGR